MRISKATYEKLRKTNNISVVGDCITIALLGVLAIISVILLIRPGGETILGLFAAMVLLLGAIFGALWMIIQRADSGWIPK